MIQSNEVRIGNLLSFRLFPNVESSAIIVEVIEVSKNNIEVKYDDGETYSENPKNLQPIPLAEEWLLKSGFEKITDIYGNSFWSMERKTKRNKAKPAITIYESYTTYMGYSVNHVTSVHQLQNLYLVLTGKELETIKTSFFKYSKERSKEN